MNPLHSALILLVTGFVFGAVFTYGIILILVVRAYKQDSPGIPGLISSGLKKKKRKPRVIEGGDEREYVVDMKRDQLDQPDFMVKSK